MNKKTPKMLINELREAQEHKLIEGFYATSLISTWSSSWQIYLHIDLPKQLCEKKKLKLVKYIKTRVENIESCQFASDSVLVVSYFTQEDEG